MATKTSVVVISGASGSGKTTIVKALADYFCCPSIHFDDFVDDGSYPVDMKAWLERGANTSEIRTPLMSAALSGLKSSGARFIFVEEPFGRERPSMEALADYVVLLEPPLELCLSRVIQRHRAQGQATDDICTERYLAKYDDYLKDIYETTVERVRSNCDLVVAAELPVKEISTLISHWLVAETQKSNRNLNDFLEKECK